MKQILSLNYAIINDTVLNHPSTIFTNDNVPVTTFETVEQLNYHIANMSNADLPPLANVGEWCEMNQIYAYGTNKVKCLQGLSINRNSNFYKLDSV